MNHTVVGHTLDTFAQVVKRMHARDILWSCLCDKKGDWAVSAQDDVSAHELALVCGALDVTILHGGELAFMIEDVLKEFDPDILEAWDKSRCKNLKTTIRRPSSRSCRRS